MSATVATPRKVWTEEELLALPSDEFSYELVDGELVMSPKNNCNHSRICMRLAAALHSFVLAERSGAVFGAELGCWMKNRNCRAPDVSFISRVRMTELGFKPMTPKFFPGVPDLAVEVLSESNTRREMDEKVRDYFESGSRLAWLIDPDAQRVEVCHSPSDRRLIGSGGFLEGENVLPGFRYRIADLFKEWDWD